MNWGLWHTWHWKISTQGNYFRDFKKARTQVYIPTYFIQSMYREREEQQKNIEIPLIYFASEEILSGKIQTFPNPFSAGFPSSEGTLSYYVVLYEFYYLHIFHILKQYTHLCTSVYKIHRFWHTWDLRKNCKQCTLQK